MNKKKIINDPVYGFISIPYDIIFDIIEHHYFQRLRRIKQLALTEYVYPGALHTRFHHALGALHLMTEAVNTLKSKGINITDEEAEAVSIAILLHDIGHGPFSHALEHTIINISHEKISSLFMQELNQEFGGTLSLAIEIFENRYPKRFLHQLVSGQLDMDRLDYLNRDSFYTGVSEGIIGYHRIIKMLNVINGELVVEEKALYSIERFITARRIMYWQVYLHKTTLSAELMLIKALTLAKKAYQKGTLDLKQNNLSPFLASNLTLEDFTSHKKKYLDLFAAIDDTDVFQCLKQMQKNSDKLMQYYATCLLHRKLFKIEMKNQAFERDYVEKLRHKITQKMIHPVETNEVFFEGTLENVDYAANKEEIKIYFKNKKVLPLSQVTHQMITPNQTIKYYLCYPKLK